VGNNFIWGQSTHMIKFAWRC